MNSNIGFVTCPACHQRVVVIADWKDGGYEVCENCGVSFNPETMEIVPYHEREGAGQKGVEDVQINPEK